MSSRKILKSVIIVIACLIFLPLLLFAGLMIALTIPSVQQKAAMAAARILSEKTGIEVSVGHFSVRPPFDILLKDVFAGDGKGDTLAFVSCLDARLRIDALPDSIAVRSLKLDNLVAHTGDLIPSVRIDGRVGRLSARVKPFTFDRLTFPITDAVLKDADIVLSLIRDNEADRSSDSRSHSLAIDLRDITLRNVKFGPQSDSPRYRSRTAS